MFSAAHGTFSKIDHILRHKASLNKYKRIEITPYGRKTPQEMGKDPLPM
jgi:hypothetical protein